MLKKMIEIASVLATCFVLSKVRSSLFLFQFLNYSRIGLVFPSPTFETHKAKILV